MARGIVPEAAIPGLYGAPISVEFVARIRGQVKFDGVAALIEQMRDDVGRCRGLLGID